MCGITGIISFADTPQKDDIALMVGPLAHRGPDGEGIATGGSVGFGHRRLSIIDLACGHQPMWSNDSQYLITFNGEIFNYTELKDELLSLGHKFKTTSDTEVILEAYRAWGEEAFSKFNGQFAFALYDKAADTTFLVRDRFGEKPLYLFERDNDIYFSSELKSLMELFKEKRWPLELDGAAFSDFVSLNYLPFDESLVKGITKLKPNTVLKITRHGRYKQELKWHSAARDSAPNASSLKEYLAHSVKLRLRSDVPVGVFLSSGVDSTLATLLAANEGANLTAFTASFRESSFSEAPAAKHLAKKLGLKQEIIDIDLELTNLTDLIPKLVYHGDEPLADSSALPVYLLSEATAKKVKVVLSGDGGDELFGGYLTYDATLTAAKMPRLVRALASRLSHVPYSIPASNKKVSLQEKGERFLRSLNLPPPAAHFAWNGMFQVGEKNRLLGPRFKEWATRDTFSLMAEKLIDQGAQLNQANLMAADQKSYLVNDILAKVDRMSMAHGLEVRPIYLDPDVATFSSNYAHAFPRLFYKKEILKQIVRSEIPEWRPPQKLGFSIPVHKWFRGRLREFAGDLFTSRLVNDSGLYDRESLLKIWSDHQTRKRNYGFELWGVMVMLLWYRKFISFD